MSFLTIYLSGVLVVILFSIFVNRKLHDKLSVGAMDFGAFIVFTILSWLGFILICGFILFTYNYNMPKLIQRFKQWFEEYT